MARPDGGMYGIKLIHPNHLDIPYLTGDFEGTDGRLPLMNFSGDGNGPSTAANIPVGHRSLVCVNKHQKFVWAIEYVGTLKDGERVALAHGLTLNDPAVKWRLFRPIRFLGKVALPHAPTAEDIYRKTGVRFRANSFTMKYVSAAEYRTIYDAIEWDEMAAPPEAGTEPPVADLPLPTAAQVEAVLRHLPSLRALRSEPSQWHTPQSEAGALTMPFEEHAPEVADLIRSLHANGFVVNFDWSSWQPTAEGFLGDGNRLTTAGIGDLQRLLTTHVRKDRFCEGHFGDMVRQGHIVAVLERLRELHEQGTMLTVRPNC